MHHPYIGFDVDSFILFGIHLYWIQCTGDSILPALFEFQASPCFPFASGAFDDHRFMTWFDDSPSHTCVDSQPSVKRQPVIGSPRNVIIDANEGVFALLIWSHRGYQVLESF